MRFSRPRCGSKPSLPLFGSLVTLSLTFGACGGSDEVGPPGGPIAITISGEELVSTGYPFPLAPGQSAFVVDGWEIRFERLLVAVGNIALHDNPDRKPSDPMATGKQVATLPGNWIVDLANIPHPIPGKGGPSEKAAKLGEIPHQNHNGNKPFDATRRYAFSYEFISADEAESPTLIGLPTDDPDLREMREKGISVFYVGTATFKGGSSCRTPPGAPSYDFAALPSVVRFRFGFRSPTHYINCQNPDFEGVPGVGGEEFPRGVQAQVGSTVTAQITLHADHAFWAGLADGSPMFFDQIAAFAKPTSAAEFLVTLDDLASVNPLSFRDATGRDLPWRACVDEDRYTFPASAIRSFDTGGVPYVPGGDPAESLRGYADLMTFGQSLQGHLNADGLCAVERHYPSPGGGAHGH